MEEVPSGHQQKTGDLFVAKHVKRMRGRRREGESGRRGETRNGDCSETELKIKKY
jgi:hypothetical protein